MIVIEDGRVILYWKIYFKFFVDLLFSMKGRMFIFCIIYLGMGSYKV